MTSSLLDSLFVVPKHQLKAYFKNTVNVIDYCSREYIYEQMEKSLVLLCAS